MKNYKPLKEDKKPLLKNFYLYENEQANKLAGLFVISKLNGEVYFVDVKDLKLDDKVFDNELAMGAQMWADKSVSEYWIAAIIEYLNRMNKGAKLQVVEIAALKQVFDHDNEKASIIYKMNENMFKEVGLVTELFDDALLQMTKNIIENDKVNKVLGKELLKDLQDTYNWMLQSVYD